MQNKKNPVPVAGRGKVDINNYGTYYYVGNFLSRLERVRSSGADRWMAKCPNCGGKRNQSLSIRLIPDGKILLHCFAEHCPKSQILSALGLQLNALFPADHDWKPVHRNDGLTWEKRRQYKELLMHESEIVRLGQLMIKHGDEFTQEDITRILQANDRVLKLRRVLYV